MGKIGYGYGSEWQLMRMLGRHREYFDSLVLKSYQYNESISNQHKIEWFDFKFKGLMDSELLGEDLFNLLNISCKYNILKKANWDCIGKIDDTYLLGEAKGHIGELFKTDKSGASKDSKDAYLELVDEIMSVYRINVSYREKWINDGFQLGNRIATQYFLEKNNINCLILYILFLEDWLIDLSGKTLDASYSVKSIDDWMDAFKKQFKKLGFSFKRDKDLLSKFMFVFPKCIE